MGESSVILRTLRSTQSEYGVRSGLSCSHFLAGSLSQARWIDSFCTFQSSNKLGTYKCGFKVHSRATGNASTGPELRHCKHNEKGKFAIRRRIHSSTAPDQIIFTSAMTEAGSHSSSPLMMTPFPRSPEKPQSTPYPSSKSQDSTKANGHNGRKRTSTIHEVLYFPHFHTSVFSCHRSEIIWYLV